MAGPLPSAASILGRLRFAQKIGLVALLLLLPLAFITWGYLDIQRSQVAFSEKERAGNTYLRPLLDLTGRAVQARHLAVSGGDPARLGLAQGVDAVAAADTRYGATLETAQVWATARSALQEAQAARSPADALARYNTAVTALLNVVVRVSDKSNLTLDPDLDSYYVMDALVFRLPILLDNAGRAVDQALVIRGGPAAQVDSARIDLAIISGTLASTRDAFATGMQTGIASTASGPLKGTAPQVTGVLAAVGAELDLVTNAVRTGRLDTIDAAAADRGARRIIALTGELIPILDQLLTARIEGFETKAYRVQAAVVVALLGTYLLFGFYRGTTVPLRRMVTALRALAGGDLTSRVPVETRDEIGTMGHALNEAIDRVRQAMEVLRHSAAGLAGSSSQLSGVSRGLQAAAEATSAQAGGVIDEAARVTHHLEQVGAGTEAIDRAVHEITAGVAEASDVTQQAAAATAASNEAVGRLGRSSAEIGEVVGVITSIAGQINLLSLNATIEAARAGDAGRGFAVVAGEVKDLSQETARATDDITARVEAIQADTGAAIAAIGHIGEIIARIDAIQVVIAAAVDEQVSATRSMGRSVAEVTAGSGGIATGLSAVTRSADNTAADAETTQRAADALAVTAEDLRQIVGQFRTAD